MMKYVQRLKWQENIAAEAVRDLLSHVPSLEIDSVHDYVESSALDYGIDLRIVLNHGGVDYALIIEVKADGAPRFVRSAVYQLESYVAHLLQTRHSDDSRRLIPMLVCPYLSPESRAICTDHDVAYLDLCGNAHLAFDNVYVDRAVAGKPKSETRAMRSIFAPKSGAVLRVMLRDPDRAWLVADLAEEADVSLGHVSNVRKALLDREWIEKRDAGVALVQPDALLKAWRENHRRSSGHRITGYTHLHGDQFEKRLSGVLNPYPQRPRAIYSLHSAAQWFAPFGRDGAYNFYADEPGVQTLTEALGLESVAKGANVVIRVLKDKSLFDDAIEPAPGIFCTSPVVTYLDLWNGNDRDREAAEYIAGAFFPWLK